MDGEAYLRRLVEWQLREIAEEPDQSRELLSGFRLQAIEAAGQALLAVGAISRDRLGVFLGNLRQVLLDRGIIEEVTFSMGLAMEEAIAERDPAVPIPKEWVDALDRTDPELVRVIPLVLDLGPVNNGSRVLLISIEAWTDHCSLRYATTEDSSGDRMSLRMGLSWEAFDDIGTSYRQRGSGGSGGRPWMIFTVDLFPALPAEAKEFSLSAKSFDLGDVIFSTSISLT